MVQEVCSMTRDDALALGRKKGASLGGQAVKDKTPPKTCIRCGQSMAGRSWHSYLGHLGLHGLADRYFEGDLKATQQRLRCNGLARQDPCPYNGAWPKYVPVTQADETR
jgi:hypothetical protein